MDLTRYQRCLDSLWGKKIHGTAFGLNLYLYPSPPVSSFVAVVIISIFYFPSCVVVKIATGSASSSPSATILRHRKNGDPHSPKYV